MKIYIDQFFSVISSWLKKWETICSDIESLEQAIKNAFSSKGRPPPIVLRLNAPDVFDYDSFFLPKLNQKLAYHSIPHQFRFKSFNGTVLCHYKMWSYHPVWLPENASIPVAQPIPNTCSFDEHSKQVVPKQKRTHVRGAAKPKLKKRKLNISQHSDESSSEEVSVHETSNLHPIYEDEFAFENLPPQGIKWVTSTDLNNVPSRIQMNTSDCTENWKASQSMYSHVLNKCQPLNPAIFVEDVIGNWRSWLAQEQQVWCHTNEYVSTLPPFEWPSTWRSRSSAPSQAPAKSESNDFAPAQQIICHDSEKHGQLTKGDKLALSTANSINENVLLQSEVVTGTYCIFKWIRK